MTLLLEATGSLNGLILILVLIMLGPAVLLAIIGLILLKMDKKVAKVFFILAAVYLIISLGICGTILSL